MKKRILVIFLVIAQLLAVFVPAQRVCAAWSNSPVEVDTSGYGIYPGMTAYMATATGYVPMDQTEGAFAYSYLRSFENSQIHHINVMALEVTAMDDDQFITVFVVDNETAQVKATHRFYAKYEALGSTTPNRIISLYPRETVWVGTGETLMFGQEGDTLIWGYIPEDTEACFDLRGYWKNSTLSEAQANSILCVDVYTFQEPALEDWELELKQALQGKRLSILGDSICAYWGVSNSVEVNTTLGRNRGWYGNPLLLTSRKEMWWQQMQDRYGLELLVNNSWCRSTVTSFFAEEGEDSYGWNQRPENLHDNTLYNNPNGEAISPDIIVLYMGFNDIRGGVSCETDFSEDFWERIEAQGFVPSADSHFQEAYALMVYKVRKNYPNAEIYIFNQPVGSYWYLRHTYNQATDQIARHYDCRVVDLYNSPLSNFRAYTCDAVHPTAAGMSVMADLFAQALAQEHLGSQPQLQPGTPELSEPTDAPKLYTGLVKDENGEFFYYEDGTLAEEFTGLADNEFGSWYVRDGKVMMDLHDMVLVEGTRYMIKGGCVDTGFTGITKQQGVYYFFTQGVNDLEFTGLVTYRGRKAYVENGEVNFNKSGVVVDEGVPHYVKYGIWNSYYRGMARDPDGTWRSMANGVFDPSYNGVVKIHKFWAYVKDGLVDHTYTGPVMVNGNVYPVKWGYVFVNGI